MNSKHTPGERGATLVELALALTLLFIFVFGTIDFSQAAYSYHFVSEVAREGTRYASVRGSSCTTWASACPATSGDVQTYVQSLAPSGINASAITVTTTWLDPGTGQCQPIHPNGPGCAVNVNVQYTYTFNFPLLSNLTSINMRSTSQLVISQ
jgi:Flp pilus assembly protein TadG